MGEFTEDETEKLRELLRNGRIDKAIVCLDELGSLDRIRAVIAGLSENSDSAGELRAVVRVIRWMRWTREGLGQIWMWIAGAFVIWAQFEEQIREWVRVWLAG